MQLFSIVRVVLLSLSIWATSCAKLPEFKTIMNDLYKDINGFSISAAEASTITNVGGAPTYGEITYESLQEILNDINPVRNDVFYDLGSGVGKVTVQVHLTTPVKKSVGVELSTTRHEQALKIQEELKKRKLLPYRKILEFKNEDIAKTNLDDATIIFMCSTCFSDELMRNIIDNAAKSKKKLRIITLRVINDDRFKLEKTYSLPMTWSSSTPVYRYIKKQMEIKYDQ
jgi:precorrin-6B methylase 2